MAAYLSKQLLASFKLTSFMLLASFKLTSEPVAFMAVTIWCGTNKSINAQ